MKSQPMLFSVVRYQPDMQRQEVVNIGTVLFGPEGPGMRIASNLTKLLALDPNLSLAAVHDRAAQLETSLRQLCKHGVPAARAIEALSGGPMGLSLSAPGMIERENRTEEQVGEELERLLVLSPTRLRERVQRASRLHSELREVFRQGKILGRQASDIGRHMVVSNYPIDPELDLYAEFALRNGKLHLTETVDFRTGEFNPKRNEAQAKTLLLVQAAARIGKRKLKRYVVVSGVDDKRLQPVMNLLSRHADDFIVRESQEDWSRYVNDIHKAAQGPELAADNPALNLAA